MLRLMLSVALLGLIAAGESLKGASVPPPCQGLLVRPSTSEGCRGPSSPWERERSHGLSQCPPLGIVSRLFCHTGSAGLGSLVISLGGGLPLSIPWDQPYYDNLLAPSFLFESGGVNWAPQELEPSLPGCLTSFHWYPWPQCVS